MARFAASEVSPIDRVLLKHPDEAFPERGELEVERQRFGWSAAPDPTRARREFDAFVALLERWGAHPVFLPRDPEAGLDSIYVRDAALACPDGLVLANMGKAPRRSEPPALGRALDGSGIPVLGEIVGEGRIEGGDLVWLDARTLAVGRGYRTNDEGIRQLRGLLRRHVDEWFEVPLPHWGGRADVLHLMSLLSPVDRDLAVVHSPLLPVPFRETLLARGIELVEVPPEEFGSMGANVLAVAPRRCVALRGNPVTRARLERAGAEVRDYDGVEISLKGSGGPTCLTRPLRRE